MPNIYHPKWREEQQQTTFPFVGTDMPVSGTKTFPINAILDASIYAPGVVPPIRLASVVTSFTQAIIYFNDSVTPNVLSAVFSFGQNETLLPITNKIGQKVGCLVVDLTKMGIIRAWSPGTYTFSGPNTDISGAVVIATPSAPLRAIQLVSTGEVFSGDVWLVAEDGVVFSQESITGNNFLGCGEEITKDALVVNVVGDPLFKRKDCIEKSQVFTPTRFVQSICVSTNTITNPSSNPPCQFFATPPIQSGDIGLAAGGHLVAKSTLRIRTEDTRIVIEQAAGQF